jgi:hypothetical protein
MLARLRRTVATPNTYPGGNAPDFQTQAVEAAAKPIKSPTSTALHSNASAEWGTPELCRRFHACVLKAASRSGRAIDVDAASSAYWHAQWSADHRPGFYFDGSPGRNGLSIDDWKIARDKLLGALQLQIGSAFCNAPGNVEGMEPGAAVQEFWYLLARMHRDKLVDSYGWQGFNLDQLRSLIPDAPSELELLHPLHADACSVFPIRRISYMAHPDAMIAIIDKRLTKAGMSAPERARLEKRRHDLATRADDSPVSGPAPTHASYITFVWSHDNSVRRRQQRAAKDFIIGQAQAGNSALRRAAMIGRVD